MLKMTCAKFGLDRSNGAKVEKRDGHFRGTDKRTDLRSLLLETSKKLWDDKHTG